MPPAIVDFRTPATASPQVRPERFSSQKPRKGQILAPPSSFSFDPKGISATDRPTAAVSARPMDRTNLGHSFRGSGKSIDDGFNGGFASSSPSFPPSPFPSVSASGKPSPAAGLSKPRLVKVRKHFASPRVRSTVASEAADDSGFNPFRSAPAASAAIAADQEGGGMRGLNEKLHSWKPFNPESGIRVSENSSGPNSSSFGPVKFESAGSTGAADQEGSGMRGLNEKLHSWEPFDLESGIRVPENSCGPKSSSFEPVKSENVGFVFGAGSASKPSVNIGSENAKDRAFSFGREGSRGFDAGPSVFGSGVKKNSDSGPSSLENLSGPSLGSFEYVKSESSGFVFVAGSASDQSEKNIGFGNSVDRAHSFGNEGSVGSETGVFVFESGVNMSSDSRWNSPENSSGLNLGNLESVKSESADFVFGGSSVSNSNKPDHTFNFASKDSSNSDPCAYVPGSNLEKSYNLSQNLSGNSTGPSMGSFKTGNSESTAFVFGSNAGSFSDMRSVASGSAVGAASGFMKEGSGKSDSGVFVCGSETQKCASSSWNLPEISGIPNLGSSESVKPKNANFFFGASSTSNIGSRSMGSGNTLGGEFSFTSGRSMNADTGAFVFGSHMGKGSNLSQSSSIGAEQGPFSKLPDEMRKLNLQSSSNEEGFEKTKQTDNRAKVDQSNVFIFGGNQNDLSSIGGGAVNMLPEEMKKLDIGSVTTSKNAENKSVDQTANMFVFGSNMKKTSASNQTSANSFTSFEKSTCLEVPNDIQKLNTDGLRNDDSFTTTESTDYQFKVHVSNGPNARSFPSNKDVPGSFEGNGVHMLHNDLEKLDINKLENSTGKIDQTDHSAGDAYTSFKFTFQAGKQGANSKMGHVPPSKTQEHFTSSGIATPFYPSSSGPGFQSVGTEFTFTSMHGGLETPHMEFRTHKQDSHGLSKENLFTGLHHDMAFNVKTGNVQNTRTKKRRGKSRQSVPAHQTFAKPFISTENCPLENMKPESPGGYSPMDYSPYQENLGADQCSREASVASGESIHIFSRCASADTERSFSVDEREEDLVSATKCLDINEDDLKHDSDGSESHVENNFTTKSSVIDEQHSGPGRESSFFKSNSVGLSSGTNNAAMEAKTSPFVSNFERQASEGGTCFTFVTSSEDFGGSNVTFAASPFGQGPLSAAKHHHRRKSRMKTGHDLYSSTSNASVPLASPSSNLFSVTSTSMQPDPAQEVKGLPSFHQGGDDNRAETNRKPESNKEDLTKDAASVAAEEACDKWRLRGNQAYANGHPSKAEEYYTRGVNSISPNETSRNCSRALMLCYSNRAATRMSLGRMREALNDCMMAVAIDPSFLRAQVRAANCHLALGDIENALEHFKKCESDDDACLGQKILLEASEGLQKAQQVADYIVQAKELILKRTPNEVTKALQFISEALSISPHSENLLEMKAEALLRLHNYEEVIQLCEQSLDSAKRNSFLAGSDDQLENLDSSGYTKCSSVGLWRWRLISKSYFYLGKLEEAIELLRKHEQVKPIGERCGDESAETSASFFVTVRELLRFKAAGNEAFQAGRHLEAVEHYTAALACSTESRPFTAICFCNRAAAYQALGQITDAIADCSLAIALDPGYPKAFSRRATLHEMIRDYGQAANDLGRLISFLEKQLTNKGNQSGPLGKSTRNNNDLNRARLRLSSVEEEARRETMLDMYMILGIEQSSSAADVKKAYRKAALKHHPDKAGQILARSENADDGLWREVADEVYKDADRLFKMIGEAYTILSDPAKRLQYDEEEEIRTALTKGYNISRTPKTPADNYSSQYEKSSNMRQWRSYGSPHKRWSEYTHSNR